MSIRKFMENNFKHFNARETLAAAQSYKEFVDNGGAMMVTLAGAMSTAELGKTLSPMIAKGYVHAISCTAANLEEDIFNLVAHNEYKTLPNYRDLSPDDEVALRDEGFNRVTDTCIPETVMRHIEKHFINRIARAAKENEPLFPYQVFYSLLDDGLIQEHFQIPPEQSWVYTAWKHKIAIYSPGFEDSTLANMLTARIMEGKVSNHRGVACGTEQMAHLVNWYLDTDKKKPIGFFQIGGGIAGDFAICSVPLIIQDLQKDVRFWQYFAQISDSTTSYGSYSGAVPNEKITWYKLDKEAPKFMINSDASVIAPLIFGYILDL